MTGAAGLPARPAPGGPATGRWGARHSLLLALVALAALVAALPGAGGPTDDAFVRYQFAKNVLRGEGFALNAGAPTYGVASPLWVGLVAAAGRAVPGTDATPRSVDAIPPIAWVARGLGAACAVLAILLLALVARRAGWEPSVALAASAMLALHRGSARWALTGIETPLAVLVAVAALLLLERALLERKSAAWAGVALGVGTTARPEFLLLAAVALAALAWGVEPLRRSRRLAGYAAGFLLGAGPWWAFAALRFHRVIPNLAAAEEGGWLDPDRSVAALRAAIRLVLTADLAPVAVAVLALALLRPWGALETDRGRRAFWWMVLAWPLSLAAGFAMGHGRVAARALVPAAPCVVLVGLASLRWAWATWPGARRRAALAALLLLYAAQNVIGIVRTDGPRAARDGALLRGSLATIGVWARRRTAPGTTIASAEVGALAFYSDRPVLDLTGRASPRMAAISAREGYDAVVWSLAFERVARPGYLVDRSDRAARLTPPDDATTPYRFLFAREGPTASFASRGASILSVYSIDWALRDRLQPKVAVRE